MAASQRGRESNAENKRRERVTRFYARLKRAYCKKEELVKFGLDEFNMPGALTWIRRDPSNVIRAGYYRLPLERFGLPLRYATANAAFIKQYRLDLDTPAKLDRRFRFDPRQFSEDELQRRLEREPSLIEQGLAVIEKKKKTTFGTEIDLLCKDANGAYVVVELKALRCHHVNCLRQAVGQAVAYVGWVKQNLPSPLDVRSIIVVGHITPELSCSRCAVPGMEFRAWVDMLGPSGRLR